MNRPYDRLVGRDLYEPPPAAAALRVSRRALFGLGRGAVDYDGATASIRARPVAREWVEALTPVDAVLGDEGLDLPLTAWRSLDLQALPYEDEAFPAVRSAFAAALAPRARRMARELVRVVRPGGLVAMTAWIPKGLPGRLDEVLERPEGVRPPSDWGRREVITQRLGPLLEDLELRTRTVQLCFPSADAFFAALGAPAGARPQFDRLLASCNNVTGRVEVDARYLLATGRRPELRH